MSERSQWRHYIATDGSLYKAIEILDRSGFSIRRLTCRTSRMSNAGLPEDGDVSIEYALPIRHLFPAFLLALQRKEPIGKFSPLPSRLL